ncbi:hypothetical protein PCANC_12320, partial [Puccinia coronata f. sp. avenae]
MLHRYNSAWRCCIAGYPTDATLVRCCLDEVKPDAKAPRLNISPTQHCIDRHRWNGRLEIALRRFWIGSRETASVWLDARLALVDTKPALLDANPLLVDATSAFVDLILSIVDANSVQAPDAIPFPAITMLPTAGFLLLPLTLLCKVTTNLCPEHPLNHQRLQNPLHHILQKRLEAASGPSGIDMVILLRSPIRTNATRGKYLKVSYNLAVKATTKIEDVKLFTKILTKSKSLSSLGLKSDTDPRQTSTPASFQLLNQSLLVQKDSH